MSRRGASRLVAVVGVAVLLAGCGGLPRSGPVVSGSRVVDDPRIGLLQVIPDGPQAGAGPAEVVRGFLLAAGSADDDHGVAREFLTAAAAQAWRADAGTTLLRATPGVTGPDAATSDTGAGQDTAQVEVAGDVLALVDATGHYVQQPEGTAFARTVTLRREGGQWRIDDPGDGVVLTQLDASRTLRPFPVYFATADASALVGDVRWFGYDSSTATRIVTELLAGPSQWLAPAVRTGAPRGTELEVGTVPVAAGVATVDLTEAALSASPTERALLLAQLRASLTRLPGVGSVTVTVDGAELTRPEGAPEDPPRTVRAADPRLVLLGPSGLSRWDRTAVTAVTGTDPALTAAAGASHPAASADGTTYAVLTDGDRVLRVQRPGDDPAVAVNSSTPLVPPSIDRLGYVWTVSSTGTPDPVVVPVGAPQTPATAVALPADGLGGRILRLRVARDGARLLVVTQDAAGATHVRVHGVVRDASGLPLRLTTGSAELLPGTSEVLDASWLVDDEVVALVDPGAGRPPYPVLTEVSGPRTVLPPVPDAVSVAAGWSERDIVVGTSTGRLLTRSGADWIVVADGDDPVYPG